MDPSPKLIFLLKEPQTFTVRSFLRQTLNDPLNWRAGCRLGESFEYSSLGISLAAHVIEYMDPRVNSNFLRYGTTELLTGFGKYHE